MARFVLLDSPGPPMLHRIRGYESNAVRTRYSEAMSCRPNLDLANRRPKVSRSCAKLTQAFNLQPPILPTHGLIFCVLTPKRGLYNDPTAGRSFSGGSKAAGLGALWRLARCARYVAALHYSARHPTVGANRPGCKQPSPLPSKLHSRLDLAAATQQTYTRGCLAALLHTAQIAARSQTLKTLRMLRLRLS